MKPPQVIEKEIQELQEIREELLKQMDRLYLLNQRVKVLHKQKATPQSTTAFGFFTDEEIKDSKEYLKNGVENMFSNLMNATDQYILKLYR
mgnify:CR=1 FL=1